MLVHEPKRVHQLVHGSLQAIVEAAQVQVDFLGASSHSPLAFALGSRVNDDVVGTSNLLAVCWFEFDAGDISSDVVHSFHQLSPQRSFKSVIPLVFYHS